MTRVAFILLAAAAAFGIVLGLAAAAIEIAELLAAHTAGRIALLGALLGTVAAIPPTERTTA